MISTDFINSNTNYTNFWKLYPLGENTEYYMRQFLNKKDENKLYGLYVENQLQKFTNEFINFKENNLNEYYEKTKEWIFYLTIFEGKNYLIFYFFNIYFLF